MQEAIIYRLKRPVNSVTQKNASAIAKAALAVADIRVLAIKAYTPAVKVMVKLVVF
jgi:hypothetical protein